MWGSFSAVNREDGLVYFLDLAVEHCAQVQAIMPRYFEAMLESGWEQGQRPASKTLAGRYLRKPGLSRNLTIRVEDYISDQEVKGRGGTESLELAYLGRQSVLVN